MKSKYNTFFEEPKIKESSEAQRFIEDYGVDGENFYAKGENYLYKKTNSKYVTKNPLRLFCKDCPQVKDCGGQNWENCKYRMELLTVINKYLSKENKELKEDVEGYKEILGEKEEN